MTLAELAQKSVVPIELSPATLRLLATWVEKTNIADDLQATPWTEGSYVPKPRNEGRN